MTQFNRALVTGGAGFIGSHIVDQLIARGCEVIILDNLSSGNVSNLGESEASRKLTFVRGDINDRETLKQLVRDIDVVFHEAAIVSVPFSLTNPELTKTVNVEGTRNLLSAATNSSVQRFVFASSAAVYGNSQELPLKATSTTIPISPYGKTKLEAEQLCMDYYKSTGIGTTVLRYFNAYGPRSSNGELSSVVNKFFDKLCKLESPIMTGNGMSTRDFIYVKDIARANILAAATSNAKGKIYNVATGIKVTINELADLELKILFGPNLVIPFSYKPMEKEDIVHSYADVTTSRNELSFVPEYSLERGLKEYFGTLTTLPMSWQNGSLKTHSKATIG